MPRRSKRSVPNIKEESGDDDDQNENEDGPDVRSDCVREEQHDDSDEVDHHDDDDDEVNAASKARASPRRRRFIYKEVESDEDEDEENDDEVSKEDLEEKEEVKIKPRKGRASNRRSPSRNNNNNNKKKKRKRGAGSGQSLPKSSLVGTAIRKIFDDGQYYNGVITKGPFLAMNEATDSLEMNWTVKYEDDDQEDMALEEVKRWSAAPFQYDEDENDDFEDRKPKARSPKRARKSGLATSSKLTCPHCGNTFSSKQGLDNHVKKYVCRIEQCTDPVVIAQSKRKRGRSKKTGGDRSKGDDGLPNNYNKSTKFRGKLKDRICMHCKRVFTSILGLEYHVGNRVCQKVQVTRAEGEVAFHTLEPGERFVTRYGVVEVVNDGRAIPTGTVPSNLNAEVRTFKNKLDTFKKRIYRRQVAMAIPLRARRTKINEVYEKEGAVSGRPIAEAYFGTNESLREPFNQSDKPDAPDDPAEPTNSFPDRIVECVWIPDKREHFPGLGLGDGPEEGPNSFEIKPPTKLFLQRRLLVEPYSETDVVYSCVYCGQAFSSAPGLRYHEQNDVCGNNVAKEASRRRLVEERIEIGAAKLLDREITSSHRARASLSSRRTILDLQQIYVDQPRRTAKKRIRDKPNLGMYPEVIIALGFKVVKEGNDAGRILNTMQGIKEEATEEESAQGKTQPNQSRMENPDDVIGELQRELRAEERISADLMHGSMYRPVYEALGFKNPKSKAKKIQVRIRRTVMPDEKPVPSMVLDTRSLTDEVDSGRYPSIKRYKGPRMSVCFACKEADGPILQCNYCHRVEHMGCVRERYMVKDPEADEPFICHFCISTLIARRNRAEKRRVEKILLDGQVHPANSSNRQPKRQSTGNEYQLVASKGQEVSELSELLGDAQGRLQQLLATSQMNKVRQRIMDDDEL